MFGTGDETWSLKLKSKSGVAKEESMPSRHTLKSLALDASVDPQATRHPHKYAIK
jgi:hypothetical protein